MEENEQKNTQDADKHELELMEIEIFRQHWRSLNAALADIRELRGADAPEVDPVEFVKHEVSNMKKEFAELKDLILSLQKQPEQQSPYPQMGRAIPQPVAPVMPYYQTPNFAPLVPINQ